MSQGPLLGSKAIHLRIPRYTSERASPFNTVLSQGSTGGRWGFSDSEHLLVVGVPWIRCELSPATRDAEPDPECGAAVALSRCWTEGQAYHAEFGVIGGIDSPAFDRLVAAARSGSGPTTSRPPSPRRSRRASRPTRRGARAVPADLPRRTGFQPRGPAKAELGGYQQADAPFL